MAQNPLNPPSFRFPFRLPDDTPAEVKAALEFTYNGLVVHEQAFRALTEKVNAAQSTATKAASSSPSGPTSSGVTSFNTLGGNVTYFPNLGHVNDQLGQSAYTLQITDNGAKVIVGDSSTVALSLDPSVSLPFFTFIDNDSSADAILSPLSGSVFGPSTIPGGGFGIVFFDGLNWWSGATRLATYTDFGYVRPDGSTIVFDSSTGSIRAVGGGGSVNFADNETPSGSGTTFTLAHAPSPAASLELYVNGLLQIQGVDYTLSSATITYGTAPTITTQKAWYRY